MLVRLIRLHEDVDQPTNTKTSAHQSPKTSIFLFLRPHHCFKPLFNITNQELTIHFIFSNSYFAIIDLDYTTSCRSSVPDSVFYLFRCHKFLIKHGRL